MAKISIPTNREVKPPLLLDAEQLEALDQVIDRHLDAMREYRERRIAQLSSEKTQRYVREGVVEKEKADEANDEYRKQYDSRYEFRQERTFVLYLTKGREIQARRFSEAASQPVDDQELPLGFSLSERVGEIKANVQVRPDLGMSVDVEPNDVEIAQQLFGALSNWASSVEAPRWQQRWASLKWLAGAALFMWLLVGVGFVPVTLWTEGSKSASKEEARKLLANGGVNTNNEQRALALLLAIESDYNPSGARTPTLGVKYWTYVSFGVVILIAVRIFPDFCIGLWKGRRRLHAWRVWIRTLTVGIPVLIGTSVLLPWILYWLKLIPPGQ